MKISFNLTLRCSLCGALINLTGEETKSDPFLAKRLGRRPEPDKPHIKWRLDGKLIKKLNDARRFVVDNPVAGKSSLTGVWTTPDGKSLPNEVGVFAPLLWAMKGETYVKPVEFRYIKCLACGGRAYLGSHTNATE